mmetsp:Transcript_14394/g.41117  ORF Transcript_14394/g.41117 Transcript_14394/m.41117 type:complete len:211 (+) Transcript_14394:781-1413(+)
MGTGHQLDWLGREERLDDKLGWRRQGHLHIFYFNLAVQCRDTLRPRLHRLVVRHEVPATPHPKNADAAVGCRPNDHHLVLPRTEQSAEELVRGFFSVACRTKLQRRDGVRWRRRDDGTIIVDSVRQQPEQFWALVAELGGNHGRSSVWNSNIIHQRLNGAICRRMPRQNHEDDGALFRGGHSPVPQRQVFRDAMGSIIAERPTPRRPHAI